MKGPLCATNAEALGFALEAGLGIALQPDFLVWDAVQEGRLVAVLDDWTAPKLALHLVTPAGNPRPIRVTGLLDFLTRRFSSGAAPWTIVTPTLKHADSYLIADVVWWSRWRRAGGPPVRRRIRPPDLHMRSNECGILEHVVREAAYPHTMGCGTGRRARDLAADGCATARSRRTWTAPAASIVPTRRCSPCRDSTAC